MDFPKPSTQSKKLSLGKKQPSLRSFFTPKPEPIDESSSDGFSSKEAESLLNAAENT